MCGIMKNQGVNMEELRVRIPLDLKIRYKTFCMQNKLSLPQQTLALIRGFLDIQEKNIETMKRLRK